LDDFVKRKSDELLEMLMKSRRTFFMLLMAVFAALVSTAAVLAQTPVPGQVTDDQVNAVAKELFCPVCENIPLDVCPTQACSQWRDLIRQKLSIGWSKDQIKEYFRQQYGDRVLAEPPREGLNWLVYILPPVFFLVGVYLVYRVMSKRKPAVPVSSPGVSPLGAPDANDPYMKRLEEELKKRN
jgi:cytochrome c-type biogenesis protein CcmH